MGSLRKYNNSSLASSNMVSARRDELEKLVGTRTRQMQRKLKDISVISLEEAKQIIDEE